LSASRTAVEEIIMAFLTRLKRPVDSVAEGTSLHHEGLDLDSLETAELSVLLEDELGSDPFSEGPVPTTVGDIYAFYVES
jgi:acyl carrier protein